MVSTRQRHTRSAASIAPSAALSSHPQPAQPRSALRSRTRTRVNATATNPGTEDNGGQPEDPIPLSTENKQHPSDSLRESNTQLPLTPTASLKQTPLTARGTRRNASTARRRPESTKANAVPPTLENEVDKDAVDDVEEPRRQRVEAVEIVQRAFKAKKAIKDQQTRGNMDKETFTNSWDQVSVGLTTTEALSMDSHTTTSAHSMDATHTDATEELSLSQMSLSPPPTVSFEYEDEDYGSPWLMVYDSNPSASRYRRRTLQANWTIEDLERELQEDNPNPDPNPDSEDDSRLDYARDGWRVSQSPIASRFSAPSSSRRKSAASRAGNNLFSPAHSPERDTVYPSRAPLADFDVEMDAGQEEGDDDPFGFAKVERQLQRTKSMRPKPVAINNWHRNDWEWDIIHPSTSQRDNGDHQSRTPDDDTSVFNITPDSSPMKVPEAGMPASYRYPSSGSAKARSRAKRTMRTEYLESMLPRPRRRGTNNSRRPVGADSWTVSTRGALGSESGNEESSEEEEEEEEEEVLVRRRRGTVAVAKPSGAKKQPQEPENEIQVPAQKRVLSTTSKRKSKEKGAVKEKEAEKVMDQDSSGWTAEQLAAHQERIRYFQQVDDFEMDVETVR
ncbi:hypothetical protein BGZ72_005302 [Mortierella alpina]|nr:hypothetical protein BGZ72_005302 [Mortierella alpina]